MTTDERFAQLERELEDYIFDFGQLQDLKCPKCLFDEQDMQYGTIENEYNGLTVRTNVLQIMCKRCKFEFGAEKPADWREHGFERIESLLGHP